MSEKNKISWLSYHPEKLASTRFKLSADTLDSHLTPQPVLTLRSLNTRTTQEPIWVQEVPLHLEMITLANHNRVRKIATKRASHLARVYHLETSPLIRKVMEPQTERELVSRNPNTSLPRTRVEKRRVTDLTTERKLTALSHFARRGSR